MVSAALYNWVGAGFEWTDKVLQRNNCYEQRDVQNQIITTVAGRKVTQVPHWLLKIHFVLKYLMVLSPNIFIVWETMLVF